MQSPAESFRIGHGYDLHRLEPIAPEGAGRPLLVGGVRLESDRGPVAHSDGDALLHAVTDALLAAAALPDIGQLFPDTDARHESRDSREFLKEAGRQVRSAGWVVANIDATVVLEKPKLSPHKEEIRSNIAAALDIDSSRVGVKGKTHEKVDAVGESRAIEVHVVALLVRN
ncbi:MAG: 2-C-methyl-D-erythritol 2,4-cyclodiphosphate synthase [Phycisphaeraceae bacterium]|nr:2-C-methyl-D-erythritol 2,4-cyclodiphosphate synthase [Phycisphaeraceae bacterium]